MNSPRRPSDSISRKPLELPDPVIDVHDVIAGLEFGKIREEAGSTDLAAGAFDGGSDVEQIGVAKDCELRVGKRDAFGKRRANENQGGSFGGGFRGKSCGGFFGFAEDVGHFVLAADVGVALEFAKTRGSEIDLAAGGELRFHFGKARGDIAVITRTRAGSSARIAEPPSCCERCSCSSSMREVLAVARSHSSRIPEIVGNLRRIRLAVALVIFRRGFRCFLSASRSVPGSSRKAIGRRELSASSRSEAVPASFCHPPSRRIPNP